ncbi:hypothetical protein [Paenibacillus ihuae]|uniref:hypothetical protein n=1 Tax=Paenibacillus ihuae TaxID=1232431 RepID=UPI001FD7F123|nr:hypothetical protein [Paenibacillus ihuae]
MDELLPYADHWALLREGRIAFQGGGQELAADPDILENCGLTVPHSLRYWRAVAERFGLEGEKPCLTAESLAARIASLQGEAESSRPAGKRDGYE